MKGKNRKITSFTTVPLLVVSFVLFFSFGLLWAGDDSSSGVDRKIELVGTEYKFEPEQLTVQAGKKIRIVFKNEGTISHDFHIKELDFKTEPIQPGNSVTYTFTAPEKSTSLQFECKVAGHGPAGMKGVINVQADGAGAKEKKDGQKTSSRARSEEGAEKKSSSSRAGDQKDRNRSFHDRMAERRDTPLKDGWGAVRGTVLLDGEPPEPYQNPGSDTFKKQCGFDDSFQVQHVKVSDETRGVSNTLVYVEKLDNVHKKLLPPETVRIVQRHCRFHPRVQVVRVGGSVSLLNSDPAVHNFNYKPTRPLNSTKGNLVQKPGDDGPRKDRIRIDTPDVYSSQCNVHPWMNGLFLAVDHHGYDVTGKNGQFKLQLPPGQYKLHVRHYTQKKAKTVTVTVPEGEISERDVKLSF